MKSRSEIINGVSAMLARAGFYITEDSMIANPLFDIIARRDDTLLLVKVLVNVDSMDSARANMLRTVASMLEATPLIVGLRTCSRNLDAGVVYIRHGITILTPDTLSDYLLEGEAPLVFSGHGGYYTRIDGGRLREIRQRKGISLAYLASRLGVSVRAVQMYEGGMCPSVDVAIEMEEILGEPVVEPIDPFVPVEEVDEVAIPMPQDITDLHQMVYSMLSGVGFRMIHVAKCPFDTVGKGKKERIVGGVRGGGPRKAEIRRTVRVISTVAHISESDGVIFVSRRISGVPTSIEGMPIIGGNEIDDDADGYTLLDIIEKRRKD